MTHRSAHSRADGVQRSSCMLVADWKANGFKQPVPAVFSSTFPLGVPRTTRY
ncbi:unnamed protein product [Periconia digitata]|uniref:Uncharacterized protein n=1 Tax=Periconia digitata TaxID=1303443 RepID=A0A9W4UBZ8_9PLEO|nr:unnamed protein product [Periconia digitata]